MSGIHLAQDDLTALIGDVKTDIVENVSKQRPSDAQIALSRFAALMDQLSPSEIEKVSAQIRSIIPALSAEKPNVDFAERAIVNISNTLLKARGGIPGFFYKITNGSPIVAVYCALVCSLMSFLCLIGVYYIVNWYNMLPEFLWFAGKEFLTTVSFAFLGAMVSIAFRLDTTEIERVGLVPLYLTNLIKPYIGAMFGIIIYCILQSRIITIAGVNDGPVETVAKIHAFTEADQVWGRDGTLVAVHDYLFLFVSALTGFLSGFSERFAADLIDRSSAVFSGGSALRSGPDKQQ